MPSSTSDSGPPSGPASEGASERAPAVPISDQLAAWSRRLERLADDGPDTVVEPNDQLDIENLIAAGVAQLAGEPPPDPSIEASPRSVLAKDLLITTDLVRRALLQYQS